MAYALRNEIERINYLQSYTIYSVTRNPLKHLMHNLSFDGTDFMVRCCGSLSLGLLGWMDRIIVPIDYPISQSMLITIRLVMSFLSVEKCLLVCSNLVCLSEGCMPTRCDRAAGMVTILLLGRLLLLGIDPSLLKGV